MSKAQAKVAPKIQFNKDSKLKELEREVIERFEKHHGLLGLEFVYLLKTYRKYIPKQNTLADYNQYIANIIKRIKGTDIFAPVEVNGKSRKR